MRVKWTTSNIFFELGSDRVYGKFGLQFENKSPAFGSFLYTIIPQDIKINISIKKKLHVPDF